MQLDDILFHKPDHARFDTAQFASRKPPLICNRMHFALRVLSDCTGYEACGLLGSHWGAADSAAVPHVLDAALLALNPAGFAPGILPFT